MHDHFRCLAWARLVTLGELMRVFEGNLFLKLPVFCFYFHERYLWTMLKRVKVEMFHGALLCFESETKYKGVGMRTRSAR